MVPWPARVGEGVALLGGETVRLRRGVVVSTGDQDDLSAVVLGGLHLADGGPGGHADDGADAEPGGGEGHALGVVAGAAGDDAPGPLLLRQGAELVVGAPELEGTGELQVLRLHVDAAAQGLGAGQGRHPGHAPQPLLGLPDHFHGQHRSLLCDR